ncbi:hypothetical protein WG66_005662 [Moniliophthora roreri]|nr:hypothetical protein WG66_005662 [Moniliophthora roreri]
MLFSKILVFALREETVSLHLDLARV